MLTLFGRLAEAAAAAEEAAEVARLLGSGHQLVFALTQQCLAASWSGEDQAAIRLGEEAARTGKGNGEWSGAQAQYALAVALINAGRREAGRDTMAQACNNLRRPMLDQRSLLAACEVMAGVQADGGHPGRRQPVGRSRGHGRPARPGGQRRAGPRARTARYAAPGGGRGGGPGRAVPSRRGPGHRRGPGLAVRRAARTRRRVMTARPAPSWPRRRGPSPGAAPGPCTRPPCVSSASWASGCPGRRRGPGRRPARPHPAGTRGGLAGPRGLHEPADRRVAVRQHPDRGNPPVPRLRQARRHRRGPAC